MNIKALEKFENSDYFANDKHLGALYFGTGLSSFSKPSIGFGIEFLSYVFTAIAYKRKYNLKKIYHEISTIGYNISDETKNSILSKETKLVFNMIKFLKISDEYELLFSHDYHKDNVFCDILCEVKQKLKAFNVLDKKNVLDYTCLQCAGMEYLRKCYDVNFKLGWLTDPLINQNIVEEEYVKILISQGKLNEGYFDNIYRFVFSESNYSFIYTHAAYDLLSGNRTAPYNVAIGQCRIVLNNEPIEEQLKRATNIKLLKKMLDIYNQEIVIPFEQLFFEIPIDNKSTNITIAKLEYLRKNICDIQY